MKSPTYKVAKFNDDVQQVRIDSEWHQMTITVWNGLELAGQTRQDLMALERRQAEMIARERCGSGFRVEGSDQLDRDRM